jgi:hypothetical protein
VSQPGGNMSSSLRQGDTVRRDADPGRPRCIGSSSTSARWLRRFHDATTDLLRLCDAYGPPAQPGDVLAMLAVRVRDLYDFTVARAAEAGPASELHRHLSSYEVDLAYLDGCTTNE